MDDVLISNRTVAPYLRQRSIRTETSQYPAHGYNPVCAS